MTTISSLKRLTANLPATLGRIAEQPQVKRETAAYLSDIRRVKSLDDFLNNDRVYRYALKAFGLEEMTYGRAFIRRILSEGIDRRDSLANRLVDPRYRELAQTFNFPRYGQATTTFERAQQGIVTRYIRQTLEVEAGRDNEGVRLALHFQRKADSISTPYGILADRALLKVAQVTLGFAEASSQLSIDRQAELISRKIDVADFRSSEKLDKFLTRFSALWDMRQPNAPPATTINLAPGTAPASISLDTLGQFIKARTGG